MVFHRKYLKDDFDFFWRKLEKGENFALCRSADGEYAIMRGRHVTAQEGWESPETISKLGYALIDSLKIDDPRLYYGISCPCCDREAYYWYRTHTAGKNLTFSNIWVNVNYPRFREKFYELKRDTVLIANYRAAGKKIGNLNILKHYPVSDDCISFWEHGAKELLAQIKADFGNRKNLLYAVSAGPLSNPLIAALFRNDPDNCYIDFGSSLDGFYREVRTRPYMIPGNTYAVRNCYIDMDPAFCLDVSAVLTAYKRPELLEKQLDALEEQSLRPREILLFQDAIAGKGPVRIPEKILKRFDKFEISRENAGVWGRFEYASRAAKCPFVCVFDDDAVPGSRFLENCHAEMMKRPALYGALGIIARDGKSYPLGKYFRVGWPEDAHVHKTVEVDFAGHAWFFKKEWLPELFAAPEEVRCLKRAGEDMAFSFQLQKKGIPTLIPPHPEGRSEFYGSLPEYGVEAGNSDEAISRDKANLETMNKAFRFLAEHDWRLLCRRRKLHVILFWIYLRFVGNRHILALYRSALQARERCRKWKRALRERWKGKNGK